MSRTTLVVGSAVFFGLFSLYAYTAAPEVTFHDSGELITGAYTLGIPHPPGSPTWCLLGYLFTRVPVGSPAYRIHLMSGFFGALTCLFVYLLVLEMLKTSASGIAGWWRHFSGGMAALFLGQAPGFWEKAVQAELYTMNAFFLAVILYVFSKWCDLEEKEDPRHRALLVCIACLFGLGAGNHLGLLYHVPVILVAALCRRPTLIKEERLILVAAAGFALTLCVYLYLPIRSMADPPLDAGNPETLSGFMWAIKRELWGELRFTEGSRRFVTMWLKTLALRSQFGVVPLALSALGLFFSGKRRKLLALTLVGCFYAHGVSIMLMQASTQVLSGDLNYITTYGVEELHIPLYLVVALFVGPGLFAIAVFLRTMKMPKAVVRAVAIATGVVTVSSFGTSFGTHFRRCNLRDYYQPHEYGKAVLNHVPEGGWIFPWSDNSLFILTYLKFCQGYRPDVCILRTGHIYNDTVAAMSAEPGKSLGSREFVGLFRSDPELHLNPMLNQDNLFDTEEPCVVFEGMPDFGDFFQECYPDGVIFKFGDREEYDANLQTLFWQGLLQQRWFKLDPGSKSDFRENMVIVLRTHATWHYRAGEYGAAKHLYLAAHRYSPRADAEFLSRIAACALEEGKLDEAASYGRRALEQDMTDKRALAVLGITHVRMQEFETAVKYFRAGCAFHPDDEGLRRNLRLAIADRERAKGSDERGEQ